MFPSGSRYRQVGARVVTAPSPCRPSSSEIVVSCPSWTWIVTVSVFRPFLPFHSLLPFPDNLPVAERSVYGFIQIAFVEVGAKKVFIEFSYLAYDWKCSWPVSCLRKVWSSSNSDALSCNFSTIAAAKSGLISWFWKASSLSFRGRHQKDKNLP